MVIISHLTFFRFPSKFKFSCQQFSHSDFAISKGRQRPVHAPWPTWIVDFVKLKYSASETVKHSFYISLQNTKYIYIYLSIYNVSTIIYLLFSYGFKFTVKATLVPFASCLQKI